MNHRLSAVAHVCVFALLAACGSAPEGGPGPAPAPTTPPGTPDTAAPSVVSISPASGTKGVRSDAKIVVTFSEAMDRASAEAAYASTELPAAQVSFAWNAQGTELTVTPKAPLPIAAGTDFSVAANKLSVAIQTSAKDLAGNALAAAGATEFSTAREVSTTLPLVPNMSGRLTNGQSPLVTMNPADTLVGDGNLNSSFSAYFTFDLSTLPEGTEIAEATLATRQIAVVGTPYTDLGGMVMLSRVTYPELKGATLVAAPTTDIMPLSSMADLGPRSASVRDEVALDLQSRVALGNRSQFRIGFVTGTDGKGDVDRADFLAPELSVKVLSP